MCAACVTQGIGYVGGALAGLQVMAARASARRRSRDQPAPAETDPATAAEAMERRGQ